MTTFTLAKDVQVKDDEGNVVQTHPFILRGTRTIDGKTAASAVPLPEGSPKAEAEGRERIEFALDEFTRAGGWNA